MNAKEQHEDSALQALADELRVQGHQAAVVANPDRDDSHTLTVDATIEIDGTEWAVDHMLLSRPANLQPAMAEAETALQNRLDAVAKAHKLSLLVSYLPQAKADHTKKQIDDYYASVVQLAEQAGTTNSPAWGDDGMASAQPFPGMPSAAHLAPFTDTTGSALLGTQLEAGLKTPLAKKLTGQLKDAKDKGWPTILVLDQLPRPGSNSRTVWIASPAGIATVVQRIMNDHRGVVDQVWLRQAPVTSGNAVPKMTVLIR